MQNEHDMSWTDFFCKHANINHQW